MATKVKPIRLNITWTPQVWNVPTYVSADTFAWWAWWGWGASFGRFLSLWDSTTGQPISFPEATPYTYLTWDYYIVETVSSATPPVNYRPTWSSYTGTASSVTESDEVEVWDTYVYDGTTWLLQSNHGKTVTFANIAWDPYDNANLDSALDAKQDLLVSWTNIKTVNNNSLLWSGNVSVWDVKYTDYNWTTLTGNSVTLALNSQITPAANFTINAPWTIKDWQEYILRVTSGWTVYAITLGTNMSNPNNVDTTLTANSVDQFVFLAVWWQLELQPRDKDTTYTASTWINISAQNEISNTWVLSVNWNTWVVTVQDALNYYSEWTNTADIAVRSGTDQGSIGVTPTGILIQEWDTNGQSDIQMYGTNMNILNTDWVNRTELTITHTEATIVTPNKTYTFDNNSATWVARLSDIPAWPTTLQVTLTTAWWSSNTQTVTATWVTSSNTVIVSPDPSSISDYVTWWVYCSAQWTDSLTFTCSTAPSNNITVNVVILN